ncbi:MAG: dipeptide epimerase [Bdellovibrio sp.]|nr:dipeptide epimerase [Bdellovibrio sp.]
MAYFELEKISLPLNLTWKIARNSSTEKNNFVVRAKGNGNMKGLVGMGEVAFNVRYGESAALTEEAFKRFQQEWNPEWHTMEEFQDYMAEMSNIPASLRFGLEAAFIHFLSQFIGKDIPTFLRLKKINAISTSFSLPIMPVEEIADFVTSRKLTRFASLKIKIDNQNVFERVAALSAVYNGWIRVDANEAFSDANEFLKVAESLKPFRIQFIEQPLPADHFEDYKRIKGKSPFPLFADESITDKEIISFHKDRFHGVNIKLMKSGGIFKAMGQLKAARSLGLKTMLGCMVETSLGISWAMHLASLADFYDLDGHLLLAADPFNLIQEDEGKLIWPEYH